jgi:hypothetical protein
MLQEEVDHAELSISQYSFTAARKPMEKIVRKVAK